MTILALIVGVAGLGFGTVCGVQLYRWERQLRGARIAIAFKGRNKLTPRLIDFLKWANSLASDKATNGQVIYKMGGTTIAILKPHPRQHGKTDTKTVKEDSE